MWVTTHEWQRESCMSCLSRIRKRFTQISSYSLFILNVPIRIYLPILQQFAKETLHLVFLAMNPVEQAWMFVLCLPARGREPRGPYTESRVICSWSEVKVIQSCPTLCDPMGYTVHGILQTRILEWVAFPFSRGIFPTQVSNPGLPHCRWILYQLSHQGNPKILEWVAYPFCSGSSPPKNQTGVSCIAGGFFTNWAFREAWYLFLETHKCVKKSEWECQMLWGLTFLLLHWLCLQPASLPWCLTWFLWPILMSEHIHQKYNK